MLARSFRSRLRATLHTRAQAATSSSSAQSPFSPPSQVHSPIDFSDSRAVYANKSSFELIRAYAVLKACGIQPLVKNATSLLKLGEKIVGPTIVKKVLQESFFKHFCAGEDEEGIRPVVEKLQSANVGSIFDYAAEADLGEQVPVGAQGEVDSTHADYVKGDDVSINDKNSADTNLVVPLEYNEATPVARINTYVGEDMCDAHVAVFEKCIEAVHTVSPNGFAAIKLTALGPPELLRRVSTALVEVRNLFDKFDQDRTGTISEAEFEAGYRKYFTDDRAKMDALMATFPRVAVEADGCPGKSIDFIEWSSTLQLKNLAELCMDCKDSGPLKMAVPTEVELQAAEDAFARVDKLAALAKAKGVRLMVDAEQTYFQPAIDATVYQLQRKYNVGPGAYTVFSTYQAYLQDTPTRLKDDLQRAERFGYNFGAKLVRGAYLVSERERALSMGYPDPCHASLEDTHDCYHECVDMLLDRMVANPPESGPGCEFMAATHNQQSVEYVLAQMKRRNLAPQSSASGVYFGQLLGMADNLTFLLGASGYRAYKYVPYGPVQEVIPYLLRRAQENSALLGSSSGELDMLTEELRRRATSAFAR